MPGGTRLDFDRIRPTTLRPFGLMWAGPSSPGQTVELRIGFSLRGAEQARANLHADCGSSPNRFGARRERTRKVWRKQLKAVEVETDSAEKQTVFSTALYHSLIKPCLALGESPFWPSDGPFVYDVSTMWDIYRTQLPLLHALMPERAVELANALLTICEEEGNFPIGYRMARGSDRFSRQGSALAHTFLADLCLAGETGIDWDWALVHMQNDLRRTYGEEFLLQGITHPLSHVLDLAFGYWCTARVAERVGDRPLLTELVPLSRRWINAFDRETGLLGESTYYEGTKYNYSFRLLHDMAGRIDLAGGDEAFVALLDRFFGYGAEPVTQPGLRPSPAEMEAGYALGRFEGLNNEPDMEAPWSYHYAGRPDRTAEVVHAVLANQFGTGAGGLPGNDDSGGLSSWYVWASLGLFPVAGQDLFLLHPPAFRAARFEVGAHELGLETEGFREPSPDTRAQYVQSVTLGGTPITRSWLRGDELRRGGALRFVLGDEPGDWGTARADRPPSWSPSAPDAPVDPHPAGP
ncbi:MAG: glycoside hydrolase family 92 protein [Actinomycetales bacterium]|nr:glycoside hydrolase family 92 protein [Actinomycetales bacterium]